MKSVKILAVVLVLMVLSSVSLKAEGGIKAGIELSKIAKLSEIPGETFKTLLGFRGGLFYNFEITKGFLFQPEVYFVQKGMKYDIDATSAVYKTKLNYVEIPLLLKYQLAQGEFVPSIFVGPYGAFRISAKSVDNTGTSTDIKNDIKSFDYGLTGGFEFAYKMGETSKLLLDLRYNFGLGKVSSSTTTTNTGKNRGVSAMVGVSF